MGLISRVSSRTYRLDFYMQNQHPILRAVARLCGVRNHRPWTRQPAVQATRDYPPAFIPPLPNDRYEDNWYCQRDNRRDVLPPVKLDDIPGCINDTKYPVPGWATKWTPSTDEFKARDACMGVPGTTMHHHDFEK